MVIWFGEQHVIVQVLLVLPFFLLFMGTFAFLGMGTGSAEFPKNPTIKDLLGHVALTMCVGLVVTIGAGILFGAIQLVLWGVSYLRDWREFEF